jgi:hypothetical protein
LLFDKRQFAEQLLEAEVVFQTAKQSYENSIQQNINFLEIKELYDIVDKIQPHIPSLNFKNMMPRRELFARPDNEDQSE